MDDFLKIKPSFKAISVSELNRQAKTLLESEIATIWVEGEISNLARPASGHVYFSLKDNTAQLRCAWFRGRQHSKSITFKNGDQVLALGKVSIFEARGEFQLIVEQLELAGEGALRQQFEALKQKLATQGLFDQDKKRTLPKLPSCIGIISSPSGAAIRDILTVLRRRFPAIPVIIYPTAVQGDTAAPQIAAAIETATRRSECDLLIVGRGGGSLEDLWPFNEEIVAHAIASSTIPTISAVGHETDITIADFVADVRAPTPSAAAELSVPDQTEWTRQIGTLLERITLLGQRHIDEQLQTLDWLGKRLIQSSPATTVQRQKDWLKNLERVMRGAIQHQLASIQVELGVSRTRLLKESPRIVVQKHITNVNEFKLRLELGTRKTIENLGERTKLANRALDAINPQATLDRGYSIISDAKTGQLITDSIQAAVGSNIKVMLARGRLEAAITKSSENDKD